MSHRILIIIGLVLAGLSVASFLYFPYAGLTTISDDAAVVRYPRYLKHQIIPSTANNYRNHQFELIETGDRSTIVISIPIAETNSTGNDSSLLRNHFSLFTETKILASVLNGVTGEKATERHLPTQGDAFTPTTNYYEIYPSNITSSPLTITYTKVDGTQGLEKELAIIKKYLKWQKP